VDSRVVDCPATPPAPFVATADPHPVTELVADSSTVEHMTDFTYRLIDTAGGEIGIVTDERSAIAESDDIALPDGRVGTVVEVYDDEFGQEGGVVATLVVEEP